MTASAAGQPRGHAVLERLLARAGWTPENLGDRLNELATSLNLRAQVHRRTPRRWVYAEAGRTAPRMPRDPWPSLVCHVYCTNDWASPSRWTPWAGPRPDR